MERRQIFKKDLIMIVMICRNKIIVVTSRKHGELIKKITFPKLL